MDLLSQLASMMTFAVDCGGGRPFILRLDNLIHRFLHVFGRIHFLGIRLCDLQPYPAGGQVSYGV